MRHIFIIGSRGLPAKYGGFETFVEELVKHRKSKNISYHIACLSDTEQHKHFDYLGADCFTIKAPKIGPARVIAYDIMAVRYALKLVKEQNITKPIFYILGNTIGAFIRPFARKIQKVGGLLFVNPDGLEWRRSKWSRPIQFYLKYAEKCMTKSANIMISDNAGIESYLKQSYPWSKTAFIAYGTDLSPSGLDENAEKVQSFYQKWCLKEKDYYLIVGRFVPENNYETALIEFMKSKTKRDLIIICNYEGSDYFEKLREKTGFDKDSRVKFVGTVYDRALLTYIRENTFAYIHGHEVGGTNPGLLEALAHTDLNLVLGVDFNKRVAEETAYYWNKTSGNLCQLLEKVDGQTDYSALGQMAKEHMRSYYTWEKIVGEYEELFLNEN
ncbi:beta 1-4 rhamnosyltransferase Cps2T [Streptococcus macacae]|uniref:DUF1972 domain-containing protein n=1 Tax=Streptococcus macacae NCTC 11558 TaxID=764298 RepID=G5JZ78_9STRE|nr:DUF1972 domain-containing protein [Streptococcus macacae]EHJ51770.1 hypothetical protein STRMA_0495 [Streptococcus macacae NCTC 11558]SUN78328.1 rhamnosyltransferase [Streptococcus macacae NCTC 11558]